MLQCILLVPYFATVHLHKQSMLQVVRRLLDHLTYAAPPGLPLVLLMAGSVAQQRLKKDNLALINPDVLNRGAGVDVVCFDKTGTLTSSAVS